MWPKLFERIASGRLKTVGYVLAELADLQKRKIFRAATELKQLREMRDSLVVPDADIIREAGRIQHKYPRLAGMRARRNSADPWVVAAGKQQGWTVVTEEKPGGKKRKRKIPHVCTQEGIACIDFHAFLKQEGI